MVEQIAKRKPDIVDGPPNFKKFAHISLPCRDLDEGIRFYRDVCGGTVRLVEETFAMIVVCGTDVGVGIVGVSYIERTAEYPHLAFFVGPDELVQMQKWLTRCGIPTSNYWTRGGVETLMFFRDPSGNLIELYCEAGFEGADKLPHGPPRGHGIAVDIEKLYYDKWKVPERAAR
jgi:catechol 2,3-dioxygenase-like lactoylglutathione lyase family enzyme